MKEIWHPAVGFETHYEVSNLGRVRSIARLVNNRHGRLSDKRSRVLKPSIGKAGYPLVSLCVDGTRSTQNVHRLVARAFIPNEANKPQVNHKDGDKANNCAENLEWVTSSENMKHAYGVLNVPHYKRQELTARVEALEA